MLILQVQMKITGILFRDLSILGTRANICFTLILFQSRALGYILSGDDLELA